MLANVRGPAIYNRLYALKKVIEKSLLLIVLSKKQTVKYSI